METKELQLVLQNCFSPTQLRELLSEDLGDRDPYEAATEAILSGDVAGEEISNLLDKESENQQQKIQSMNLRELRNSLSPEFLEPGRKLGLILWGLLRDNRMGARGVAGDISSVFINSKQFKETEESPAESDLIIEPSQELTSEESLENVDMHEYDLEEVLHDLDETEEEPEIEKGLDLPDEDLEFEQLLSDISEEEDEDKNIQEEGEESVTEIPISTEEEKSDNFFIEEEAEEEFVDSEIEELEDEEDIEELISSLNEEDEEEKEINEEDLEELELVLPKSEEETEEDEIDDDLSDLDDLLASISGDETEEEGAAESIEELPEESFELPDVLDEIDEQIANEINQEIEETLSPTQEEEQQPEEVQKDSHTVALGGVEISLASLKRACERVFEEPVELVTDSNLTSEDKIVVVGKHCGIKVLHGPRYAIQQPEEPVIDSEVPVSVSPVSMQASLSKIFGETIELIPDPNLLNKGVIVFSGKETGISVLENPRLQIPLPPWVNEELAKTIEAAAQEKDEELNNLQGKVKDLENRLAKLEQQPLPQQPEKPPAGPAQQESPKEEPEGEISEESISLDEIETEELEPVTEPSKQASEEESEEEDLVAALADELGEIEETEEETKEGTEEETEEDSLDDLGLDELIDTEETEEEDSDQESTEEEEVLDEDISLEDIDLSEIGEEESDEDIDLDKLAQDLDLGEEEETEEDTSEESEEDQEEDLNLDDIDLDVLNELEQEEENGFEPKKVFNEEHILLLGGEEKHEKDYQRVVEELGGKPEWYQNLSGASEDDIAEMVERADLIMTLSSDALADPGILQTTNYAQENNKRLFQHHSSNPTSVQKQLVKLVDEGKI